MNLHTLPLYEETNPMAVVLREEDEVMLQRLTSCITSSKHLGSPPTRHGCVTLMKVKGSRVG